MPPGDIDSTVKQDRTTITPGEIQFGDVALQQAYGSIDSAKRASQDPRLRALTIDSQIKQKQDQLKSAQAELTQQEYYHNQGGDIWWGGPDVMAQRLQGLRTQVSSLGQGIQELTAEKQILPEQLKEYASTQEMAGLASGRLRDFLSGTDLGVSPEERKLISEGISGISQDVATTRGLNRSDTPVMQAIAPAVSQALLAQANSNRSLFTGVNQFQQGMGLSNRQLQAGLAGQNPAANLTGVYAGLSPGGQNQSGSRGLGGSDIMGMFGQGAMGAGLGLYGLGAAGLLGGGGAAAAGGGATAGTLSAYGGSMAMGCWIAEAIYGTNAPETGVIRWWLNIHFAKQPVGRVVMALYGKYGRWMAGYVQRWAWLRQVLRPMFDMALRRGLATG